MMCKRWLVVPPAIGLFLLGGCSTLPSSGPTAGQVLRQEQSEENTVGFRIVDIDPAVVSQLASSASGTGAVPTLSDLAADGRVDTVGPGDVLSISIYEVGTPLFSGGGVDSVSGIAFDPSAQRGRTAGLQVDQEGTITMPYVGRLHVAGRTPAEISQMIEAELVGLSQSPQAVVVVASNFSNAVVVMGNVRLPSRVELTAGRIRLLDAIAEAGGSEEAPEDLIVRFTRGGRTIERPFHEIRSGSAEDLLLLPGDRIQLIRRVRTYTVFGASDRVSQIPFEAAELSLAEAVARAGGPADRIADPTAVFLFRDMPEAGTPTIYRLNMKDAASYFLAQRFPMRDKDAILIANAASNEPSRLVQMIGQLFGPLFIARQVADSN